MHKLKDITFLPIPREDLGRQVHEYCSPYIDGS